MAKGLGKGLEGLFEDNSDFGEDMQNSKLTFVKITSIEPDRNQPRKDFDKQALDELSQSVAQHGVLQPIIVRPLDNGQFRIISGERRWRASRLAGLTEMPVLIKSDADERLSLEIGLIENLQREDLNIIEQAKGYRSLIDDFSMTQADVAQRVGKSRPAIANTMRILVLPEKVLDMVSAGDISSGHARALLPLFEKNPSAEYIIGIAEKIVKNGLTVRDVEAMAKKPKQKKTPPRKDIYLAEIETKLSEQYGRKVKISYTQKKNGKGKGELSLQIYSYDDLEKLLSDLMKRGE